MNKPLDFSDKRVVVTLGGEGQGAAVSECFLSAGAEVIVCGPVKPDNLPVGNGREALFMPCVLDDPEELQALFSRARQENGPIDILINNPGELDTTRSGDAQQIITHFLVTPLNIAQAAFQAMNEQTSGGSIIFVAGETDAPLDASVAAYRAASAGISNLVTSLAVEWAPAVRVNAVTANPSKQEASTDLGNACLFLASTLSDYVSGSTLSAGD